jgi:homoaconitase/3-isopropylmalate dehydratase large subunit
MTPQTLFDRIWKRHVVATRSNGEELVYIDRHLLTDATSLPALEMLSERRERAAIVGATRSFSTSALARPPATSVSVRVSTVTRCAISVISLGLRSRSGDRRFDQIICMRS